MKELYRKNQWVLAIFDEDNYVLYDHTKSKVDKRTGQKRYTYKYFAQPLHAVRELARLLADEACTDLSSWIKCLGDYHRELNALLSTGQGVDA